MKRLPHRNSGDIVVPLPPVATKARDEGKTKQRDRAVREIFGG
jgi:hypothetical protein